MLIVNNNGEKLKFSLAHHEDIFLLMEEDEGLEGHQAYCGVLGSCNLIRSARSVWRHENNDPMPLSEALEKDEMYFHALIPDWAAEEVEELLTRKTKKRMSQAADIIKNQALEVVYHWPAVLEALLNYDKSLYEEEKKDEVEVA